MKQRIRISEEQMFLGDVAGLHARAIEADDVIMPQCGGQEKLLSSPADIIIYGGCRGGGKSYAILLEALRDCLNKHFRALILRSEIGDLSDLILTSNHIYERFGVFNRSKSDLTWIFNSGARLKFDYYAGTFEDFKTRMQGKQFSFIALDEITQCEYEKFKYLLTDNRNAHHIRNRFFGTCNPDEGSWVMKFIEWWIDDDGYPIPERDGVVRYCFMDGESPADIVWGNSREEVFQQCRNTILQYWRPRYERFGTPQQLFIKSVAFIEGRLDDNVKLMSSDPAYLANLANQSEENRARDLDGCWRYRVSSDDYISAEHMQRFFDNAEQTTDGILRASCDVAFSGGDNLVIWLWKGWHAVDVATLRCADSRTAMGFIKQTLAKWNVREENFTFDVSGLGQGLKGFFPKALPFNNREAPVGVIRGTYDTIKSQCAFMFADKLISGEVSINPDLLSRKMSGIGFSRMPLQAVLMRERRAIRPDTDRSENAKTLIKKAQMRKIVGHSPDFIEAMLMRTIFDLKRTHRTIPSLGLLGCV